MTEVFASSRRGAGGPSAIHLFAAGAIKLIAVVSMSGLIACLGSPPSSASEPSDGGSSPDATGTDDASGPNGSDATSGSEPQDAGVLSEASEEDGSAVVAPMTLTGVDGGLCGGAACATTVAHAQATCSNDVCGYQCVASYPNGCSGGCVNFTNDASNCGSCGHPCTGGQICGNGTCGCAAGMLNCGGTCASCASPPTGGVASCSGTKCAFTCTASGTTACGNACVDLKADASNCGSCAHGCQGGQCLGGTCQPVTLATFADSVTSIAVNSTSVFWSTSTSVYKCAIGGCAGVPGVLASGLSSVPSIAADDTKVYIASGDSVVTCPAAGCPAGVATLATSNGQPVEGVAVNSTSAFWSLYPSSTLPDAVATCPLGGCSGLGATNLATVNLDTPANQTIGTVALTPAYAVFTIGYGSSPSTSAVAVCSLSGGCGSSPTILYSVQNSSVSNVATNANGSVFWGQGSTIETCPASGCGAGPRVVANGAPFGLAADTSNVYWTDGAVTGVQRCAVTGCGGTPTTIAKDVANSYGNGLVLDSTSVYWSRLNPDNTSTVLKVAK